jgi:hypothetical protein
MTKQAGLFLHFKRKKLRNTKGWIYVTNARELTSLSLLLEALKRGDIVSFLAAEPLPLL